MGDLVPGVHAKPPITRAVVGAPISEINEYYGAAIEQVPHCNIYHSEKLHLDIYALYDDNNWCQGLLFFEAKNGPLSKEQKQALDDVNAPQGVKTEWKGFPQHDGSTIWHADDSMIWMVTGTSSRGYATVPGLKLLQEVSESGEAKNLSH